MPSGVEQLTGANERSTVTITAVLNIERLRLVTGRSTFVE